MIIAMSTILVHIFLHSLCNWPRQQWWRLYARNVSKNEGRQREKNELLMLVNSQVKKLHVVAVTMQLKKYFKLKLSKINEYFQLIF